MLKIMIVGLVLSLFILGVGCFKLARAMKNEDADAKGNANSHSFFTCLYGLFFLNCNFYNCKFD